MGGGVGERAVPAVNSLVGGQHFIACLLLLMSLSQHCLLCFSSSSYPELLTLDQWLQLPDTCRHNDY